MADGHVDIIETIAASMSKFVSDYKGKKKHNDEVKLTSYYLPLTL
jgi:hypothetical protein